MPEQSSALAAFVTKLNSIGHLSEEDRRALEVLPISLKNHDAGHDLACEGERPLRCCILVSGWTCRHKGLPDGERQILSLQVRGDLIDLQSLNMPVMDHTLTALTPVQIAYVSHGNMRSLLERNPHLNGILWRSTLVEAATTRQWLLNLGRRNALERIAHLLCETYTRLASIGLANEIGGNIVFPLPLTQARLGQAMGMSAVHVNRSLQTLRAQRQIKLASGYVTILDWLGLQATAGFERSYLGLEDKQNATLTSAVA